MKVLPILFNTEMVQAILDGRKIVTRRVIKPQYPEYQDREPGCFSEIVPYGSSSFIATHKEHPNMKTVLQAPYRPGDILYVRETWAEWTSGYVYKADGASSPYPLSFIDRWHPSIHMPKAAARLFLRVENVKAERLQEGFNAPTTPILEVQAEGIDIGNTCRECLEAYTWPCCVEALDDEGSTIGECGMLDENRGEFSNLWDSTIKPAVIDRYGWAANPWVWVIAFEPCEKPEEVKT